MDKGEESITANLDICNLIRAQRTLRVLKKTFLTKQQRILSRFDRHNYLDEDEDTPNSSDCDFKDQIA
jgi:hypothetical protein